MNDDDRYTRITLRLPKDLHRRLSAQADLKSHSLNAEIVANLEYGLQAVQPKGEDAEELRHLLKVNTLHAEYQAHLTRAMHYETRLQMIEDSIAEETRQLQRAQKEGDIAEAESIQERLEKSRSKMMEGRIQMANARDMAAATKQAITELHRANLKGGS